ncbi:MAG: hypothetical protein JO307_32155 [Bryobacterales bacterium]|nr:hypothetical protein [Bryobacterales bacterium]MBV9400901.1 hypothetical protein [Bryobacterales bacterium]
MHRESLHKLVDRIPEDEMGAARRFLEYLALPAAYRAALGAPQDDEPVTESEAANILRAQNEVRAGTVVSHEEILREFGLQ